MVSIETFNVIMYLYLLSTNILKMQNILVSIFTEEWYIAESVTIPTVLEFNQAQASISSVMSVLNRRIFCSSLKTWNFFPSIET